MKITTERTDKLPLRFKLIILAVLIVAAVILIKMCLNDDTSSETKAAKEKTQTSIDSLGAKMHNDNVTITETAKTNAENANQLTKTLQHEKIIVSNPGNDSIARFIAEYRYTE